MWRSSKQPLMSDLHIVLLGTTGAGKSASGNTILGGDGTSFREDFSPASVTRICESAQTEVDKQRIRVIDTVGLPDTLEKITDVQTKIEQIFDCTVDGVDVFLLVIRLGVKFTEENRKAVKWIQDNFGEKASKCTIVLFTHGDELDEPIENYLKKSPILQSVVDQYSGRYHVFDNKDKARSKVSILLGKINKLKMENNGFRYHEGNYKKTQDRILNRKCVTRAAVGGGVGSVIGGTGCAVASKAGVVAITAGKAAAIGATGGAVLAAAAVGFGVYFFGRKYICKSSSSETAENMNKKQK